MSTMTQGFRVYTTTARAAANDVRLMRDLSDGRAQITCNGKHVIKFDPDGTGWHLGQYGWGYAPTFSCWHGEDQPDSVDVVVKELEPDEYPVNSPAAVDRLNARIAALETALRQCWNRAEDLTVDHADAYFISSQIADCVLAVLDVGELRRMKGEPDHE